MSDNPPALHMAQLDLIGMRLAQLARQTHLPPHSVDTGYLVHIAMKGLFQDHAPQPFAITRTDSKGVTVLGYCTKEADHLRQHADAFANPLAHSSCRWESFATKPMPVTWPVGQQLKFEVRACPVIRKASQGPFHAKGAEVDAFVAKCWDVGDSKTPVSREEVYLDWLRQRMTSAQGVEITNVRIKSFQLHRLSRRTQAHPKDKADAKAARKTKLLDKPAVVFEGSLSITDSALFGELLSRGIGRHKAFAFGMLLLKPE